VAPEPFGDGVRDLEECSGRVFLFGAKERRVEGKRDGRGSLTAGRNGPGRREKAGRPGFPRNGRERTRKKRRKREGRGSLAMGGNGPGREGESGMAGVPSQRERTGQGGRERDVNKVGKRSRSWRLVRKLDWKRNEDQDQDRDRNRNRNELCRLGAVLLLPWLRHGGTARGRRLAAGAVGELGSVRSPGIVGRKKHGFRGGFGGRGHGSWLRANFLPRLGERMEFFRHREHFLVTSLQILDANFYYCIESVI
jgi:hypothetical protein